MQGRDVLSLNSTSFVEAQLIVSDDSRVTMTLKAGRARFPTLKLADYEIEPTTLQKFESGEIQTICCSYIATSTVCVLPNLTRGRIESITREMLTSNELRDLKDMRRYWKNMYGFRWPYDEGQPKFFVNVTFGRFGGYHKEVYSYPDLCVRPYEPFPVPRVRQEPIIVNFLKDLKGTPWRRSSKKSFLFKFLLSRKSAEDL